MGKEKSKAVHLIPFQNVCDVCSKHFRCNYDLQIHRKAVHEKIKSYQCPKCPKRFGHKPNLSRHLEIHLEIKRHKCPTCNYSSNTKPRCEYHVRRVHQNNKPYAIELEVPLDKRRDLELLLKSVKPTLPPQAQDGVHIQYIALDSSADESNEFEHESTPPMEAEYLDDFFEELVEENSAIECEAPQNDIVNLAEHAIVANIYEVFTAADLDNNSENYELVFTESDYERTDFDPENLIVEVVEDADCEELFESIQ